MKYVLILQIYLKLLFAKSYRVYFKYSLAFAMKFVLTSRKRDLTKQGFIFSYKMSMGKLERSVVLPSHQEGLRLLLAFSILSIRPSST